MPGSAQERSREAAEQRFCVCLSLHNVLEAGGEWAACGVALSGLRGGTLRAAWWHSQSCLVALSEHIQHSCFLHGHSPAVEGLQPSSSLCKPARPWHVLSRLWAHKCPFARCPYLIHILFFFSPREQVRGINPDLHVLDDTASLLRELEALNSSLFVTNSQYQSKRTQFESSRSTDLSGTALQLQHLFLCSHSFTSVTAWGFPWLAGREGVFILLPAQNSKHISSPVRRMLSLQPGPSLGSHC